jgi:phenylacetate-CoA ligase
MHQALINMHHLTPQKIGAVVRFLNEHEFQFYSGYPSVAHAMAYTAMQCGLRLTAHPKYIITGAENVLDFQRRDLEAFTGATLTDQWGVSEGCGNASQCPEFAYHEDSEFCIIERVGGRVTAGGIEAQMVCTGFANPDFPFLRYEVGDVGLWAPPEYYCPCGREAPVIKKIIGRTDDFVITPEGNRIMRFDYCFKDIVRVKECQVVQDRLGEIRLRIVRRPEYCVADERQIARAIQHWISPSLGINFEYIDEIERERAGKFRAVKSNLQKQETDLQN